MPPRAKESDTIYHESDRALTRVNDDNLVLDQDEPELAQLTHAIDHDDWKLVKFDIAGHFGAESQAKAEGCPGEVPRYTVAHQRDLCRTQGESCNFVPRSVAIVALVDHVHDFVGPRVHDANLVEGRLEFFKYQDMQPVYTEYNIGHYRRSFSLSSKIDQNKIGAEMADG